MVLSILLFATPLVAENIGFVDLQKVFVNYKETDVFKKDFEKKQKELRKEAETYEKKIKKAQKSNKNPEDIKKMVVEMQEDLRPKQEELMKLNNQIMAQIRNDVIRSTKKVSKQYGVDLVLDKQALLSGGFDLTDFVIEDLNSK